MLGAAAGAELLFDLTFFLLCFFTCFLAAGALGADVCAGALLVGACAPKERAAARAVPDKRVKRRFIVFFLLGAFRVPSLDKTIPPINRGLNAS